MDNVKRIFVPCNGTRGYEEMLAIALFKLSSTVSFTDIITMTPMFDEHGLTMFVIHK